MAPNSFTKTRRKVALSGSLPLSHQESMEYPFPPFFPPPHPPFKSLAMKTPPTRSNSKPAAAFAAYKRTAFTIILTVALFLWIINPFSGSPRQPDRVPFLQDSVEEWVKSMYSTKTLLTGPATFHTLRDLENVASNQHRSTCLQIYLAMPRSTRFTARTVQHFWMQ